jgi:serine/threonine-protein kinase HipA
MKKTEKLKVMFHERTVGWLTFTPDNRLNVFEYDKSWLTDGFSRYLLHKSLLHNGINDSDLSSLDRLALIGDNGMMPRNN